MEFLERMKVTGDDGWLDQAVSSSKANVDDLDAIKSDLRVNLVENKDKVITLINNIVTYILKGRESTFFDKLNDDEYITEAVKFLSDGYEKLLNANVTVEEKN